MFVKNTVWDGVGSCYISMWFGSEIENCYMHGLQSVLIKIDNCLIPLYLDLEVNWSESCSVMCNSLRPHVPYSPWNSPGQNTGVCSFSLLQGIFPTQRSNPGIEPRSPVLQEDSLPAEPPGKPIFQSCSLQFVIYEVRKGKLIIASSIFPDMLSLHSTTCNQITQHFHILFGPVWCWKSLQMVTAAMKLKDAYSLEGKLWPT